MKKITCIAALLCLAASAALAEDAAAPAAAVPAFSPAPELSSIAAVVNDDVISSLDLENRLHMVFSTTHLEDTSENRERIRPQVLQALVNEKLEMQEATKNNIVVKQSDLDGAVATIEQRRSMQPGQLLATLDALGVPRETFYAQIRAQLAWNKLIGKTVRPKVKVTDDEIEREMHRVQQEPEGLPSEVQLEVLALPVDHPENEHQVEQVANRLAEGVRKGASFESVAHELADTSAINAQTIEPFWVPVADLEPGLAKALEHAKPGTVIGPVRTLEGYTLARLMDVKRAKATPVSTNITEVVYKDILLRLKQGASKEETNLAESIAKEVAAHPGSCAENGIAGMQDLQDMGIETSFKSDRVENLPDPLKSVAGSMSLGSVSEPYASSDGIKLFMLCERVEKPATAANREEATQRLFEQKMELESDKYLRNLRRDAVIDVRS